MPEAEPNFTENKKQKINVSFSPKLVIFSLLAIIALMLAVWKPWDAQADTNRVIEVTGEAKITEKPDEFIFYPSYEFKNPDKDAALKELEAKSSSITAKLKELGVADEKIKTNSSGFDYPAYYSPENKEPSYNLQFTITSSTLELAQKIQDYLVTTTPTGMVSPQSNFSDAKRKELESKARDEATKSARSKADQSAKNLGFKVGKVKSVTDGTGFGIMPYGERAIAMDTAASSPQLSVQPGENDLSYSVTVIYYLK